MAETPPGPPVGPPGPIAFLGLGMMGQPMAARLLAAGFDVRGFDPSPPARAALAAAGGTACDDAEAAVSGCRAVVAMLPTGAMVADALLPLGGRLGAGGLAIDMSSSEPAGTRALSERLAAAGVGLVDAPVSGGVRRARDGTLSVMAGGDPALVARARPVLEALGGTVFATGPVGSGHAMKALNNYVSAAGLLAACEALRVGAAFGLDPETMTEVLNASTGRNNSTEVKLKPFVISRRYDSGFSLRLMAKDLGIAGELARQMRVPAPLAHEVVALWRRADAALPGADHTAIDRFLEAMEPDA